jgi:hypothetical protein
MPSDGSFANVPKSTLKITICTNGAMMIHSGPKAI